MKKTVYRIRNSKHGLFSTGTTSPNWNKSGKTWSDIGHVKAHLRLYASVHGLPLPRDWEIVQYDMQETVTFRVCELVPDLVQP
jgi:hypothetical protein